MSHESYNNHLYDIRGQVWEFQYKWPNMPRFDKNFIVEPLINNSEVFGLSDIQRSINGWVVNCFGASAAEPLERGRRVVEESMECAQAVGLTKEEVLNIVNFVYDNKPGDMQEELGDAIFTLLALCETLGINSEDCIKKSMDKIKAQPPEYWAQRRDNKRKAGISE